MKFLNKKKKLLYFKCIRKLKREIPFFIFDLKSELIKSKIDSTIFLKKIPSKILHQILFTLFVNSNEFGKNLAYSYCTNKKFIFPLPLSWLNIVEQKIKVDYLILPFWYMSTPERVEYIKSVFNAVHIIPTHFALDSSQWMQSMGGLDKVRKRTFAAMDNLIQLDQEMQCITFK